MGALSSSLEGGMAAKILGAIQASHTPLESQIGGVQVEIFLMRQDLWNVVYRVTETEG